jgi:hypothetical protein
MSNTPLQNQVEDCPQTGNSKVRWFALPAAALVLAFAGAAQAQSYMNLTIGGAFAPGVYGQIAIGDNPPPPVLNVRPVIVGRPIHGAPVMYLHVSPQEHKHWGRYCARYQACGRPVQFVRVNQQNRWWENHNVNALGEGSHRQPEYKHDNRRDQRDGNRHDNRDENRH